MVDLQEAIDILNTQSKPNQERILETLECYNSGGTGNVFLIPLVQLSGFFIVFNVERAPFKTISCELKPSESARGYSDESVRTIEGVLVRTLLYINLIVITDLYEATFAELDVELEKVVEVLKSLLKEGISGFSNPSTVTVYSGRLPTPGETKKGMSNVFPLEGLNSVIIDVFEDDTYLIKYNINGFSERLYPAAYNDRQEPTNFLLRCIKNCVYSRAVIIDAILTLRLKANELFEVGEVSQ